MLGYYLKLGLVHLRRNPALTALMVLTLAVGVAASMATLTILHAMSSDPIPDRSDRLFVPLLDLRPDDGADRDDEPPDQVSYRDAVALVEAGRAKHQSVVYGIAPVLDPGKPGQPPSFEMGLAVHNDFFPMFGVPFVHGGPWGDQDDATAGNGVVVREGLAERLFGTTDAVGQTIRLGQRDHVITGVISDEWKPIPKFYRLIAGPGPFGEPEQLFMPFATAVAAEMRNEGSTSCFGDAEREAGFEGLRRSECVWMQLWVELESADDADGYRDFLDGYVAEQRKLGRFPLPTNNRLYNVRQWLDKNEVVSNDARLQTYLAFGFLLVCLVNTIGLLLAKFTARSGEIGVRRALGASRRAVFQQYLIEAGVVGLVGGLAGLALTFAALWMMARQSPELAELASMDWTMLVTTFVLAITASLIAGLLPTWRACQVRPAVQLKSQ